MEQTSTIDLGREAVEDFGRLVRDELALARDELREQLTVARGAALVGAAGAAMTAAGTTVLLQAFAVKRPRMAVLLGSLLLGVGISLGLAGRYGMPRRPLGRTRARVSTDARLAKEAIQ
jgi:hypothetical protein